MQHLFSTHGLYILSGPPASGKSTWTSSAQYLPSESIVSTDALRIQLFGTRTALDEQLRPSLLLHDGGDKVVFEMARAIVEQRMREKLVTVVDATNTTESERAAWAQIAEEAGMPVRVLFFNPNSDILTSRDASRVKKVGARVIEHFVQKFSTKTKYDHTFISPEDTSAFQPPQLPHDRVDVIGDTHGLYSDLMALIEPMGYRLDSAGVLRHPDDRKLLFLGDWIDRGPDSVACLRMVHRAVADGGHFAVLGNHEVKVMRGYRNWVKDQTIPKLPLAGMETLTKLWTQSTPKETEQWMKWMRKLPPLYQHQRFLFCHADVQSLDPYQTPASILFYGESNFGAIDTDASFSRWSEAQGENGPILIRGHIPPTNENSTRAFSLERHVGFAGTMMAIPLDKTIADMRSGFSAKESVQLNILTRKTTFDFDVRKNLLHSHITVLQKYTSAKQLDVEISPLYGLKLFHTPRLIMTPELNTLHELEARKLVAHKTQEDGLMIYKYHRRVFFDNLWGEHKMLMHARGLVLGPTGEIVQNPFVKVFNYGERDSGKHIADSERVEAVEKMNGFLGCVTKHPYLPDSLLVTTTGSFDSDFVGYINDFITPELKKSLLNRLSTVDQTLLFEVIHPKDPHIIEYKESQQGLYLIGARGKDLDAPLMSERDLDALGSSLGIKRPKHYKTSFGALRARVSTAQHEGYLVRSLTTGEPLLKFKTAHYLTVKFIGRMGVGMVELMFKNPHLFKQKVDEEYYPLVDLMTTHTTKEAFTALPSVDRVAFVRSLVEMMWHDIQHSSENTIGTAPPPSTKKMALRS
jgi:predicted kinase